MSEKRWLASDDPQEMLWMLLELMNADNVDQLTVERKLRLFAVAQFRQLRQDPRWHEVRCDELVQLAIQHTNGLVSLDELEAATERLDQELDFQNQGSFLYCPIDWMKEPIADAAWLEQLLTGGLWKPVPSDTRLTETKRRHK
jgi:hypothetical protein